MNVNLQDIQYDGLIKSLQKKRRRVIALTVIAVLAVLLFASSTQLEIGGETVVSYSGWHPVLTIILILFCIAAGLMAYVAVSTPLTTSLESECDPHKHLILNAKLNKQKNMDAIYAADYMYLGIYEEALKYTDRMIATDKKSDVLIGLFNRARCEFLQGDCEGLRQTVNRYSDTLSKGKELGTKSLLVSQKMNRVLHLMCALLEDDADKIDVLRENVKAWSSSTMSQGFVNYLKGVAAYKVEDEQEAIYRLKFVEEFCSKTVLGSLAEEYLARLH